MRKRRKVKCSKCQIVLEETAYGTFEDILRVRLEGGYAEFVDDIVYSKKDKVTFPLYHYLCHKCAHELTEWLNIPAENVKNWHPKTEDSFCDGWAI